MVKEQTYSFGRKNLGSYVFLLCSENVVESRQIAVFFTIFQILKKVDGFVIVFGGRTGWRWMASDEIT